MCSSVLSFITVSHNLYLALSFIIVKQLFLPFSGEPVIQCKKRKDLHGVYIDPCAARDVLFTDSLLRDELWKSSRCRDKRETGL